MWARNDTTKACGQLIDWRLEIPP